MMYAHCMSQKKSYKELLFDLARVRRDRRIPRRGVQPYKRCPFEYLLKSKNDQSLLNATGHDHASFAKLLALFKPYYDYYTIDALTKQIRPKVLHDDGTPRGRMRDMKARGALGLVLMWYRTKGSCTRSLALMFGQTSTPMYRWLKFSRKVLLHVLSRNEDAIVRLPTNEEVSFFKEVISAKYDNVPDVWAAADGLKLEIEQPQNDAAQNKLYNGWTHGHYVNSVFVFSPDGKIRMTLLNAPGTFHDSAMADYGIYDKMEQVYNETGGKVVVDSAFNIGQKDFLIKSSQQDPADANELLVNRDATSVRQLSEWGMRMIQGSFPRLTERIMYEERGGAKSNSIPHGTPVQLPDEPGVSTKF